MLCCRFVLLTQFGAVSAIAAKFISWLQAMSVCDVKSDQRKARDLFILCENKIVKLQLGAVNADMSLRSGFGRKLLTSLTSQTAST